jgi:hypothetical protein
MKKTALLIVRSIIVGLAVAYVVLLFLEPAKNTTIVEIGQNQADQVSVQATEITMDALRNSGPPVPERPVISGISRERRRTTSNQN